MTNERLLPYSWDETLKGMRATGYGGEPLAKWLIRHIALDNLKSEFKEGENWCWFILTPRNPDDLEFMAVDSFKVELGGTHWARITYMGREFHTHEGTGVKLLAAVAYAAGRLREGSDEWKAGREILGRERMLDALGI
jgi:hypothetical protein